MPKDFLTYINHNYRPLELQLTGKGKINKEESQSKSPNYLQLTAQL